MLGMYWPIMFLTEVIDNPKSLNQFFPLQIILTIPWYGLKITTFFGYGGCIIIFLHVINTKR